MADEVRSAYRELNAGEKQAMLDIKAVGQQFLTYIDTNLGSSRELSLAKTKIEEAVMWAVKHITRG